MGKSSSVIESIIINFFFIAGEIRRFTFFANWHYFSARKKLRFRKFIHYVSANFPFR